MLKFSGYTQFFLIAGTCSKYHEQDCSRKKFKGTFEKKNSYFWKICIISVKLYCQY